MNTQNVETYEQRREREDKETAERNKTDRQTIANVCEILNFERVKEDDGDRVCVEYKNDAGEILFFSSGGYGEKDRIFVSGTLPRYEHGGYVDAYYTREMESERISVSRTRAALSPQTIAKDIERRCLPAYRAKLAKVREIVAKDTEYRNKTEKTFRALTGRGLEKEYNSGARPTKAAENYDGKGTNNASASVEINGDSVEIRAHGVTVEQAKAILKLLGLK